MKTLLYVHPTSHATDRVIGCRPDIVVLDLEEAVPPAQKVEARLALDQGITGLAGRIPLVLVRINTPGTDTGAADLAAVNALPAAVGLLLPKPLGPLLLQQVAAQLQGRTLWLMAEQLDLLDWLPAVLAAGLPVGGLVVGGKDLSLERGLHRYDPCDPGLRRWVADLRRISRPHGLALIDAVALEPADIRALADLADAGGADGLSFVRPRDVQAAQDLRPDAPKKRDEC